MKIKQTAKFASGCQDGAIWNGYFFAINAKGLCRVYSMDDIKKGTNEEISEIDSFELDRKETICPHSNAVMFGKEYYSDGDEYPILYTNIYNNYEKDENRLVGVCLAYRIERKNGKFTSTLVQMIETGFVENSDYWCSDSHDDIRPFGNFVIDVKNSKYWAFTMRDKEKTTRYFSFDLPGISDGVTDEKYGIKKVTLDISDIKTYFDCDYHNFIQGATFHDGKVYSVEGFSVESGKKPAIRVIDVEAQKQIFHADFSDFDVDTEPEMIDFYEGVCYYADGAGQMFVIEEI